MRALRHGFERGDLIALALGSGLTCAVALVSGREGTRLGLGSFLLVAAFLLLVTGWVFAPQYMVGLSIPLFVVLPAAKVFVAGWIGPLKDLVTLAAAGGILIILLQREERRRAFHADRMLLTLIVAFACLYVVNLGGSISGGGHGIVWAHGVRLVTEPLILLTAGLTLSRRRNTLKWAVNSLIGTGVVVALYGIVQQILGAPRLISLGYSYHDQVRTIGGRLRSFGTLDEPFAYAAFLMLALVAVIFWMRRGALATLCATTLALGVVVSFVRSALMIAVALIALWLVRRQRTTLGVILLAVSLIAALTLLLASAGANQTRAVPASPGAYLTLNGRTTVWGRLFSKASHVPFGLGVGKVGTAAQRAQFGVTGNRKDVQSNTFAVDSGYFATIADVGLVGIALLLLLFARLALLGRVATREAGSAGWLVLAWLFVLMLDAVTRASFTGFPTAFLGLLLVGVALADAAPEHRRGALVRLRRQP